MSGVTDLQSHATTYHWQPCQGSTGNTTYLDDGTTSQHIAAAMLANLPSAAAD